MIFFLYPILLFAAIQEMNYDRDLAEIFDKDGRTEKENALMHNDQIPIRGMLILLAVFVGVLAEFGQLLQWESLIYLINYSVFYWISFDIIVNLFWLKKSWHFTGTSWGPEKRFKWVLWIVKFVIFFATIFLYYLNQ